jgi:hypothetical protein
MTRDATSRRRWPAAPRVLLLATIWAAVSCTRRVQPATEGTRDTTTVAPPPTAPANSDRGASGEAEVSEPLPPASPRYEFRGECVGPFLLGDRRDTIIKRLGEANPLQKLPPRPNVKVAERGVVLNNGKPLCHLLLEDGELVEVEVLAHPPDVVGVGGVGLGSSLDRLTQLFGPPRPFHSSGHGATFVFADLPGVLFRFDAPHPTPQSPVTALYVVGPEFTRPDD